MSTARFLVTQALFDTIISKLDPVEYVNNRILKNVGEDRKLWDYQEEMIRVICDPLIRKVGIVCSRQAGKTEGIALGALYLAYNTPNLKIGFFAPKEQQAAIDVERIKNFIKKNKNPPQKLVKENATLMRFENNSEIHVVSASDQAEIEGLTFDIIVLEESQKISDYTVSERILPMGGATGAKIIQIGTPKARNHFWKVFKDPTYTRLMYDWLKCHNLHRDEVGEGTIKIGDRKYGRYVLSLMPRDLKQEFFKEELAVAESEEDQELIDILTSEGEMSVEDFKTQYMLVWAEDAGAYLSESELNYMKSGTHEILERGIFGEEYYVGIDFASSENSEADSTAITVLRRNSITNILEKVFFYQMNGISYPNQIEIIKRMFFYPSTMLFDPKKIFADYTGVGRPVVDMLKQAGLPITGIVFNATDTITKLGTNFKNSMFNLFKLELIHGRFKYPERPPVYYKEQLALYRKSLDEWSDLQVSETNTQNKKIYHMENGHDDHVCSDVLACYAAVSNKTVNTRPRGVLAQYRRK